jgi:hypothetical protein
MKLQAYLTGALSSSDAGELKTLNAEKKAAKVVKVKREKDKVDADKAAADAALLVARSEATGPSTWGNALFWAEGAVRDAETMLKHNAMTPQERAKDTFGKSRYDALMLGVTPPAELQSDRDTQTEERYHDARQAEFVLLSKQSAAAYNRILDLDDGRANSQYSGPESDLGGLLTYHSEDAKDPYIIRHLTRSNRFHAVITENEEKARKYLTYARAHPVILESGNAKIAQYNEFAALARSYGQFERDAPSKGSEASLRQLLYIPSGPQQLQHGALDVQLKTLGASERLARMSGKNARANPAAVRRGNDALRAIYE